MRVWRSPVLYFGIFLVVAVALALIAPFVMDWGTYRAELQAYGKALTGREVTIQGPVTVRLFPWPRLTMEQVSLANPAAVVPDGSLITADRVEMKLQLAGLVSGDVRVDSIAVSKPVVALLRQRDGAVNWQIAPPPGSRAGRILDRVRLDQITFNGGTLLINDEGLGLAETVTGLQGSLAAPTMDGPWKAAGHGQRGGEGFAFSFGTSELAAGKDTSLALRLTPDNAALPMASFQGANGVAGLSGTLRLEPRPATATGDAAKGDLEGEIRPLVLQAEVTSNAHQAHFTSIRISPADPQDQGTLIEGDALARFGDTITMVADFSAPRINLDALAGAASRSAWRQGGGVAVVNGILAHWPQRLSLDASLRALAVTAGGAAADNVRVKLTADKSALRFKEVKAGLPGQTRAQFTGIAFPGQRAAELAGTLSLETADLRSLSGWLWPDVKAALEANWTGARGHLKAEGKVNWNEGRLSLQQMAYDLDGGAGTADIAFRPGAVPGLDVNLTAQRVDLDSYLPQGMSALSAGHEANWFAALNGLIQSGADFEQRLTLALAELKLNGVTARDVAMDVNSGLRGLEIKRFDVGSAQGAALAASGSVLSGVDGPDGTISGTIRADEPSGLVRLLGLADEGAGWVKALGQTALDLNLTLKPGPREPDTRFAVTGRSGTLDLTLTGGVSDVAGGVDATVKASADVGSAEGADIARLFGLAPPSPSGQPGRLSVTLNGSRVAGFATVVEAGVLGATAHFDGTVKPGQWPEGTFRVAAAEGGALVAASGVPLVQPFSGGFDLSGTAKAAAGEAPAQVLWSGHWGAAPFDGTLTLDRSGAVPNSVVRLNAGALALGDVLAPVFLPWTGAAPGSASVLAAQLPKTHGFEIWVTPKTLTLGPGLAAHEAELGISVTASERRLALSGRDAAGAPISLDLAATPDGEVQAVTAQFSLPVALDRLMTLENGTAFLGGVMTVDGTVSARGRSAMAVISSVNGSGSYRLSAGRLMQLSPQLLPLRVSGINTAASLKAALDEVRTGPGLMLGEGRGGFTVKEGIVSFDAMTFTAPGSAISVTAGADLGAGAVSADIRVQPGDGSDLPAYGVSYAGEPMALSVREDFGALASKLGVRLLEQGVAELEKAQKEQERLAAQEQAQRAADQARFDQWQATRAELRQRQREVRVQAELRAAAGAPWPKLTGAPAPKPVAVPADETPAPPPEVKAPPRPAPKPAPRPAAPKPAVKPAPDKPAVEIIRPPSGPSTRVIVVPP